MLSQRTGCPSRPDALFLPGSIGKLYTATLVMMLVEEGKLDLDVPIRRYLPDFEVRDPHARDTVTARQLLSHTSGFDGDHFTDTGRGDDALARYVAGCSDLPQIVAPGKIWSYSNSGYAILGRVVEVLSGLTFEEACASGCSSPWHSPRRSRSRTRRSCTPSRSATSPIPRTPRDWSSPRRGACTARSLPWAAPWWRARATSCGSSASTCREGSPRTGRGCSTPPWWTRCGSRRSTLVDDTILGEAWGLGWILDHWGDVAVIGHDGNSLGQNAFMRVAPAEQFGFCLQTNVESALSLYRELADWLFGQRLGVTPRRDPDVREDAVTDTGRYVGTYARVGLDIDVHVDDAQRLVATVTPSHGIAEEQGWPPMVDLPLQPVDREDSFLLRLPIADADLLAVFFNPDEDGGRPTYLHYGGRAHRRT